MNSWAFTGNLGSGCETRFLGNGDPVCTFSVAVKSGFGDKAITTWVRCNYFGKRAEGVAPYLTKGALVGVVGEAALRPWTDKSGNEKTSLELRVSDLTLLGSKGDRAQGPAQQKPERAKPQADFDDTEPPF